MLDPRDHSSPFAHSHRLADGARVRLRMPKRGDRGRLLELLAGETGPVAEDPSTESHDLALARLVRHDPRQRAVICAVVSRSAAEEHLIGVGSIRCEPGAEPEIVVLDTGVDPLVGALIADALRERVRGAERRAA